MKISFSIILSLLVSAVIFTIPSNLFLNLNDSVGYVNGLRIDYLIPKLYLSDLIVLTTIAVRLTQKNLLKKLFLFVRDNKYVFLMLSVVMIHSIFFAQHRIAGVMSTLKIIEIFLFSFVLWQSWNLLDKKLISNSFLFTIVVSSLWAILQFFNQASITPYWVFGETQFNGSSIGINIWINCNLFKAKSY